MFSFKSIIKNTKLNTFPETTNISKKDGVYSLLKLLLEAEILSFKDSHLQIPTFEKMVFKVLVPLLLFFNISNHEMTAAYQLPNVIKWIIIVQNVMTL